jgi:glycerol uptake facilitator-like aquaporin
VLGPVSGAHFNPAVSLAAFLGRGLSGRELGVYTLVQLAGAALGVVTANVMFGEPAVTLGTTERSGAGVLLGELVATAGLVLIVWGAVRRGVSAVAAVPRGSALRSSRRVHTPAQTPASRWPAH